MALVWKKIHTNIYCMFSLTGGTTMKFGKRDNLFELVDLISVI